MLVLQHIYHDTNGVMVIIVENGCLFGWLVDWILWHVNPCWVILCQSSFRFIHPFGYLFFFYKLNFFMVHLLVMLPQVTTLSWIPHQPSPSPAQPQPSPAQPLVLEPRQNPSTRKRDYNISKWSIEEKKITLHCFTYSRYEKLVGWLVGFYGMSTHWVILCRIRFYLQNSLYNSFFLWTQFFFMNTCFDLFNP